MKNNNQLQPEEDEYYQSREDEPEPYPVEYNEGMDHNRLLDCLDGFSKKYGDQKLINILKEWLCSRMGGKWIINNKQTGLKAVSY